MSTTDVIHATKYPRFLSQPGTDKTGWCVTWLSSVRPGQFWGSVLQEVLGRTYDGGFSENVPSYKVAL